MEELSDLLCVISQDRAGAVLCVEILQRQLLVQNKLCSGTTNTPGGGSVHGGPQTRAGSPSSTRKWGGFPLSGKRSVLLLSVGAVQPSLQGVSKPHLYHRLPQCSFPHPMARAQRFCFVGLGASNCWLRWFRHEKYLQQVHIMVDEKTESTFEADSPGYALVWNRAHTKQNVWSGSISMYWLFDLSTSLQSSWNSSASNTRGLVLFSV